MNKTSSMMDQIKKYQQKKFRKNACERAKRLSD